MIDRFTAYCFLLPPVGVLLGNRAAGGWIWDFANGLGFAALAGLVYLSLQGRQRKLQITHKHFSYIVLTLLALHIVILLAFDSLLVEYALPGAPLYMWSGTLAALLLIFIVISTLPNNRKRSYLDQDSFRSWHKPLSWFVLACVVYHVIGSGFYMRSALQWMALLLLFAPLLLPERYSRRITLRAYSPLSFLAAGIVASALLSISLNWAQP